MERIGHEEYYVQGGDYGAAIGSVMATLFPDNILGFHTNMPMVAVNTWVSIYLVLGKCCFENLFPIFFLGVVPILPGPREPFNRDTAYQATWATVRTCGVLSQ